MHIVEYQEIKSLAWTGQSVTVGDRTVGFIIQKRFKAFFDDYRFIKSLEDGPVQTDHTKMIIQFNNSDRQLHALM